MTTPGDQSPPLAERLLFRIKLILAQPLAGQPITAEMIRALSETGTEISRLTLALAASDARLAEVERERDEAYRQNPILREQVRELQERLAVLDEAYRAVTEQLSRSATLAATAEVERDS